MLREPLGDAKSFADGWSSWLLQRLLAKTLQDEEVYTALDKCTGWLQRARQSACDAVNRIVVPRGGGSWFEPDGVNVWVHLPPGVDAKDVLERSAAEGVRIATANRSCWRLAIAMSSGSMPDRSKPKMLARLARFWVNRFLLVDGGNRARSTSAGH